MGVQTMGNDPMNNQISDVHIGQLASVGQIAAGIAHEVRNPLTSVKGFLQLLKEKSPDTYIDVAEAELNNALLTLENLLQVSKPDMEDELLSTFNLCAEIESILYLFQDQQYRVKLETNFENVDSAIVSGKRNQLKKTFFNLFKNAFEAIPDKGTIYVNQFIRDGYVYILVKDTGVGIPKDKCALLGTPFFTTKENGTGMGLTQVFTTIYQHGGRIEVDSEENVGTTFRIILPIDISHIQHGVVRLNIKNVESGNLKEYLLEKQDVFEQHLLSEAVNVRDKINEIHTIGNIDLLGNAQKLVLFIVENRRHELMMFAQKEGEAWAKHSLTIAFKLEWLQAIRRVLWNFLYNFDRIRGTETNREEFFTLEKNINDLIDQFLNSFFISYTNYKEEVLQSQQEIIEDLSVPIIPIIDSMCILPLIGKVDNDRMLGMKEKIFNQISQHKIMTLIMDFSGVAIIEEEAILYFLKILEGISMMGCKTVITGIRPECVNTMIDLNLTISDKAETYGTLNQALEKYLMRRDV